jgi:hypothetical protein
VGIVVDHISVKSNPGSDSDATRVFSQIPLSLNLGLLWKDAVSGDIGKYVPSMDAG